MANTYAKTPRFRRNVNEPYIIIVSKLAQTSSTIWVTFVVIMLFENGPIRSVTLTATSNFKFHYLQG